ncbi:uncharacterized protein ARMOST_12936 [Armillaria ostoyae]|uniref:Uncharacterized protein n=1 Tax=Armillaria ostoyae TaxID=47428 RepID=A0A284RLC1_ARMOS|nr:uncharacterized protein ARMOST_12936 [Armillaria ostoyae]
MMLQLEKEVGPSPGVWPSLRLILLASWLNLLLLFILWALHFAFAGEKDTVNFVCAFKLLSPWCGIFRTAFQVHFLLSYPWPSFWPSPSMNSL